MQVVEPLDPAAVRSLRNRFAGDLIQPADARYEEARLVWNALADKRPALVARCARIEDVVAALDFAREQELVVAVRGGGHSIPGLSTCDGGVVIDLSPMSRVTVQPQQRTARVEGGALLRQLDGAAQEFALACPVGVVGHTGVGGLTLGGGIGRLQRKYGLTIDNLLACDVVGAEGQTIRASADENSDLYWGLRGAGANFGVVTSFEFRLSPVGPGVTRGALIYPLSRTAEVASMYRELAAEAPRELFLAMGFGQPGPLAPDEKFACFIGIMHCGPVAEAERYLRSLRATQPLSDTIQPMAYLTTQAAADEESAWGKRVYMKAAFLPGLPEAAVLAMAEHLAASPSGGDCSVSIWAMGGAIADVPADATPFSGREAAFWVEMEAVWGDATLDEAHRAWPRAALDAILPLTVAGNYVNAVADSGEEVVRAIYGPAKYERLKALKRRYDPDNVFRLNQNIAP